MDKNENSQIVLDVEQKVKEEFGSQVYAMFGPTQRCQLIQERLPTKPLYCLARIREIVFENNAR
jgi:hypothetical protein